MTFIDPARPWTIITGDCRDAMRRMEPESVDAIVTDTPYGLSTLLDPPNLDRESLWQKLTAGLKESPIRVLMRSWLDTGENPVMKGRGFMGKEWDALVPPPATWRQVWRVLKPGAYCLAFAGTRTYDLITMALRSRAARRASPGVSPSKTTAGIASSASFTRARSDASKGITPRP
mgnify:CR=1 FL=1